MGRPKKTKQESSTEPTSSPRKSPRKAAKKTTNFVQELPTLLQSGWKLDSHEIPYNDELVIRVQKDFINNRFKLEELDSSEYLENYLYLHLEEACMKHAGSYGANVFIISVVELILYRFASKKKQSFPSNFALLFNRVLELSVDSKTNSKWHCLILSFLMFCFESLEVDVIRTECLKLVSIECWKMISEEKRNLQFAQNDAKLGKFWRFLTKKYSESDEATRKKSDFYSSILCNIIENFLNGLNQEDFDESLMAYLEKNLELLIALESQIPTRRYFHWVIDELNIVAHLLNSKLYKSNSQSRFNELVDLFIHYFNNFAQEQDEFYLKAQKIAFSEFPSMHEFTFAPLEALRNGTSFRKLLELVSADILKNFAERMLIKTEGLSHELIIECLVLKFAENPSMEEILFNIPSLPTEEDLFDESKSVEQDESLAYLESRPFPKLNLQFLNLQDYVWRNYNLYRMESVNDIRDNIENAVKRMNPVLSLNRTTEFTGWSRMVVRIDSIHLTEVGKPKVGESVPGFVKGELHYSIARFTDIIKDEWDSLKPLDVLFLVGVEANETQTYKVKYVRGCQIDAIFDQNGSVVEAAPDADEAPTHGLLKGDKRRIRILLDPMQYQMDLDSMTNTGQNALECLNLVVRRKAKENNFKGVLDSIKQTISSNIELPEWLEDTFLGYGNPKSSTYQCIMNQDRFVVDYQDTFVNSDHLKSIFPSISVDEFNSKSVKIHYSNEKLDAELYENINKSPYPPLILKKNLIPFTATQVEAIKCGTLPGLTMIVGPPGTGKTDVATQILYNIYKNFPAEKTLIITHSNHALNQLFEKLFFRDIDERHLLRLGYGEEDLDSESNFTQYGRVSHLLERKFHLLQIVDRLAKSMNILGDFGYTCETACNFFAKYVAPRWNQYMQVCENGYPASEYFPFYVFFSDAPQPLLPSSSNEENIALAQSFYDYIQKIFVELEEIRPFEILKSNHEKANYLMTKEAKIIAMTCTYAALKRAEMIKIGLSFDNVLIEEAGQILEIETFMSFSCQRQVKNLKRLIMVGDHNQLPPIVKDMELANYSHFDQSCFSRLIRLGFPYIQLDNQGRTRPSLCNLFRWKYQDASCDLGDMPHVKIGEYCLANTGLLHEFQFVNVSDYNGEGESCPVPYYYQNLGEAEYVVAVYQYLILCGYSHRQISILATYNGQVDLIKDVLRRRTKWTKFFKNPKISTVDKYQGQQNDIILLSLVRTRNIGHVRDARRLIVAMSRARLGLYVFGRTSLFFSYPEFQPCFKNFKAHSDKLQLVVDEPFPTERTLGDSRCNILQVDSLEQMGSLVYEMSKKKITKATEAEITEDIVDEEDSDDNEDEIQLSL